MVDSKSLHLFVFESIDRVLSTDSKIKHPHTPAGCRLYPCNVLISCHLSQLGVQPEIIFCLKFFRFAVVPFFNIKCSDSTVYRGTTYNQHPSCDFFLLSLPMTVLKRRNIQFKSNKPKKWILSFSADSK